ncbi:MAG: nickel-dependent hydrogenase large subunit [Desulfosarcina sp.]|nr:nickel-dependent hydrogenase large subunit [Desulfobacterales bacterium]
MAKIISIDPITRIEGHLAIRIEVESNLIAKAYSSGEMFRGFETILKGRDPLDAQQITQRICGVCPVSHGIASILAQDQAYGNRPPKNGRILRNLIMGANYLQSHILHFYHLSALDFVDIAAILNYKGKDPVLNNLKGWVKAEVSSKSVFPAAPFLPRYKGKYLADDELNFTAIRNYLEALDMRAVAHKAGAIFAGKLPHAASLIPGGVTEKVTADKIAAYKSLINKLRSFIDNGYLNDVAGVAKAFPDYLKIGKGCGNFLAYGAFPESESESNDGSNLLFPPGVVINGKSSDFNPSKITEDIRHSLYSSASGIHPSRGKTIPSPHKTGAYSWIKAPRYDGLVMEVGPLARVMVAYLKGENLKLKKLVDGLLSNLGKKPEDLVSVMGRHAARAIEAKIVADRCAQWVDELLPGEPSFKDFSIPETGTGVGLTEAPRGALGHWLTIKNQKIERYQCVVPTTWNCSPRDDSGKPGPVEQALQGTLIRDDKNPLEATRIVRSFDPCIACAVH